MKLTPLLVALVLLPVVGVGAEPARSVFSLVDEVTELFPDTRLDEPVRRLVVHTARNTIVGGHILITGLPAAAMVSFAETGPDGQPTPGLRWLRLMDVPVLENTGLDRNTEKYSGKVNPFVVRRAPFRVYDPLQPVVSPQSAEAPSLALRAELSIGADAPVGEQVHRLRIEAAGRVETLEFVVVVHRATVPPVSRASVAYVNWHSLDNLCTAHGVEKWSEPFWAMVAQYARLMARGRQNAFWFNWADYFAIDAEGNVTDFKRERLERYIRVFLAAGLTIIEGAPMYGRRDWEHTDMLLYVPSADGKEIDAVSDKSKRMLGQMTQRVAAMMQENGWDQAWVQGVFDEPEDPFIERYRTLITLMRTVKPDLRILEATLTLNATGLVNIWCPQVHEFQAHQDFYAARQAAGDQVWVYTCLAPGGPWLNRLLDQERLRQVYLGWALAKFNLQGYLHWGGNHHTAKPFEELVRFHMVGQYLPAGDSHVWYPAAGGPLSSHRFEAHRIGLEDCELLVQLKRRDPSRASAVIARVLRGFDDYGKDPAAYRAARQALLEAVDAQPQ